MFWSSKKKKVGEEGDKFRPEFLPLTFFSKYSGYEIEYNDYILHL